MKNLTLVDNVVLPRDIKPEAVMFDTHIFDELLKNSKLIKKLELMKKSRPNMKVCITNIQFEEINATPDLDKKNALLSMVDQVVDEKLKSVNEQWFILASSTFGNFRFASENESTTFKKLNIGNSNHCADALIATTAKSLDIILVTNEKKFLKRAKKENCRVLSWGDFLRLLCPLV